jgi:hypothetical protein
VTPAEHLLLVEQECRGVAPAGTAQLLGQDTARWRAALVEVLEDVHRQLASRPDDAAWRAKAFGFRRHVIGRLVELKRTAKANGQARQIRLLEDRLNSVRRLATAGDLDGIVALLLPDQARRAS